MARYGMPWQGSKSKIAEWVVGLLPSSNTLVDLFAGGGAITHCALLSGKWQNIIANDITDSMKVFCAAINGEFENYSTYPTRDEWLNERSADTALALVHSFGNDRKSYLWSPKLEAIKRPASLMLSSPSVWERYQWYHRFCDALSEYLKAGKAVEDVSFEDESNERNKKLKRIRCLQSLLNLQGLNNLHSLQESSSLSGLCATQLDYRLVDIPEDSTVYADPPYRSTANSARYGNFDFDAFDQWLLGVDFPVFVSEFDAPAGCVEIACINRSATMAATTTKESTERIFVQERFAGRFVDKEQVS